MNGKDLLNSLSFVDDELIQEAETKKIKKTSIKFLIPLAASFAVVVTAFSIWMNHQNTPPILSNDNTISPTIIDKNNSDRTQYALNFNHVDGQTASDTIIEGHFWEKLSAGQTGIILPLISEKYQVDGIVNYSKSNGNITIFSIDTNLKIEEKEDIKITIAPNEIAKCYILDGKPIPSEIEGISVEAGIFTETNNGKVIFYADFKIDDISYYVEFVGNNDDKEIFTNIVADIILGGHADLSIFNPTVPELRDDRLTEDEAYTETDFGRYLPEVPNNYQFNDAVRFINQESNLLRASWSQEFDDLSIRISNLSEDDKNRIISINDTTLYDMSLYPIPWSESVPRDISEIVDNPIFKIEELTLDAIKMREYTLNDSGDTNRIHMRFSVLYDDVIVEVSSEGVQSEYLFKQLSSLPRP